MAEAKLKDKIKKKNLHAATSTVIAESGIYFARTCTQIVLLEMEQTCKAFES